MFLLSFLATFLNPALDLISSFVDVSGLVSGLDSQTGSELPFATTVDQIELRRSLWSRF